MDKTELVGPALEFLGFFKRRMNVGQQRLMIRKLQRIHARTGEGPGKRLVEFWRKRIGELVRLPHSAHPEFAFTLERVDRVHFEATLRSIESPGRWFTAALVNLGVVNSVDEGGGGS